MTAKRKLLLLSGLLLLGGCVNNSSSITSESGGEDTSSLPPVSSATSLETSTSSEETPQTHYENPVWEPVLADPTIIRGEDRMFYAYGTNDNAEWGDYFGVKWGPILKSPDLVNWEFEDSVFQISNAPSWGTLGAHIWAPDIIFHNGKYLYYYSLSVWGDSNPGIGVASGDTPTGPFTDHGKIFTSDEIGVSNSIDQVVIVEEGRVYMIWGSFMGIYAIELSSDGLALKNPETAKDDKILLAGLVTSYWNPQNHEGAFIRKINNYYYMFLSSGSCCDGHNSSYHVLVARSENLLGPYVDKEGRAMANQDSNGTLVLGGNERFVGVGHNTLVADDAGDWWILYHGFDKRKEPQYGTTNRRSLLLDKLLWTKDGWPYVANYGASYEHEVPYIT
ncbi:MAG TPA: family 43 glycosylhydrolase [Bacilli bacterium]|nr:family 43 glycosylhydrolase [Bacilli bacterium]